MWGCHYVDQLNLGSLGALGDIFLMWHKRVVEKMEEVVGQFSISCRLKNVENQFEWAFTGVYETNTDRDRRLFQEEMYGLLNWWNVPWCVGGDFNVICFPTKLLGTENYS